VKLDDDRTLKEWEHEQAGVDDAEV